MKAIAWVYGLFVGLVLNSSSAFALSCAVDIPLPPEANDGRPPIDAKLRQQIDAQMRQRFDDQTRAQFGAAEIVAEAKVISLGETTNMQWTSSQLVEVAVTRYLRAPLTKQVHDRYYITATPSALKVNDTVLFFARAEAQEIWQARLVPPNPEVVQPTFEIPATWTQRVWYAQGACTNPVYQLSAPENTYLVQFVRQLADDKLAPSSLRLSFSTRGSEVNTLAEIPVTITEIAGAKASRTFRIKASGTELDLHAGRYRLLWPELPGYQPACSADYEKLSCEADLVAGGSASKHVQYLPTAQVTLVPFAHLGTPIKLLGELEWQRIDASDTDVTNDRQVAIQNTYVRASELDRLDDDDGYPIVPGRYQLNWVVKSYAPSLKPYDACALLHSEKIAVRWRIGTGEFANEHDLRGGHSVVFAEIPESQTVNLEFTKAEESRVDISVKPRCADIFSVSVSGDSPLNAVAFRGQQYELEYGCYGCKPRQENIRKIMQADQDLVLDLK